MKALCLVLVLLASACAGSNLKPEDALPKFAHVLSAVQDAEIKLIKVYNRLCAERLLDDSCVDIAGHLNAINAYKDDAFTIYNDLNGTPEPAPK